MKKNNITLIGMPAAGKSTIGILLAKALGYHFIDGDILIQEREGLLLQQILDKYGQEYFRQVEDEVNAAIEAEDTVIAPGGSIIFCPDAMAHLKDIGQLVYIKVPYDTIEERCTNMGNRGINMGPDQTLLDVYNQRIPYYERFADLVVETGDTEPHEAMRLVLDRLQAAK